MVADVRQALSNDEPDALGQLLADYWLLKKKLASSISNPEIDRIYEKALDLGATGGKLLGAGGGGFLLLYVPREYHDQVRDGIGLRELPFQFEKYGSKIIFDIHRT
jgi:D-glycero-alpha-D-manno-heptose-7-phosphate kinase